MGIDETAVSSRTAMPRRMLLSRVAGVAALGVASSAFFGENAAATGLTSMTAYSVKDYGAAGNGTTDDHAAIQSAINAAAVAGGTVFFPPGHYALGTSVILKTSVHLLGSGVNATILQLKAGVNAPVLISSPGTTIYAFSIRNMTVDGNKAQNTAGAGLQLDANDWIIESIEVRNCAGDGFYSVSSNDNVSADGMEAYLSQVKVHDNYGNGITWNGPHDSFWSQIMVFFNGPGADTVDGVQIGGNGFALFVDQLHVYGGHHRYGLHVIVGNQCFHNCQIESASTANVYIEANNVRYIGGTVYNNGVTNAVGFKIGNSTKSFVAGLRLETEVTECTGGVFTTFQYGPFNSVIDIMYYNSNGAPAYPAGVALPIRSYVNILPITSTLPTPAQTQLSGWLALREPWAYPSTNPSDGGVLYVKNGALMYRGKNGTVTTIAPA